MFPGLFHSLHWPAIIAGFHSACISNTSLGGALLPGFSKALRVLESGAIRSTHQSTIKFRKLWDGCHCRPSKPKCTNTQKPTTPMTPEMKQKEKLRLLQFAKEELRYTEDEVLELKEVFETLVESPEIHGNLTRTRGYRVRCRKTGGDSRVQQLGSFRTHHSSTSRSP